MWEKNLAEFSLNLLIAILVVLVGYIMAKLIGKGFQKVFKRGNLDQTVGHFLQKLILYLVMVITLLVAAGQLGIQMASIATILGAVGLTIALGLKDYFADLTSGIVLLILKPFQIGDEISVMGEKGEVQEINLFLTKIIAVEKEVLIPNSKIIQSSITKFKKKGIK